MTDAKAASERHRLGEGMHRSHYVSLTGGGREKPGGRNGRGGPRTAALAEEPFGDGVERDELQASSFSTHFARDLPSHRNCHR